MIHVEIVVPSIIDSLEILNMNGGDYDLFRLDVKDDNTDKLMQLSSVFKRIGEELELRAFGNGKFKT